MVALLIKSRWQGLGLVTRAHTWAHTHTHTRMHTQMHRGTCTRHRHTQPDTSHTHKDTKAHSSPILRFNQRPGETALQRDASGFDIIVDVFETLGGGKGLRKYYFLLLLTLQARLEW